MPTPDTPAKTPADTAALPDPLAATAADVAAFRDGFFVSVPTVDDRALVEAMDATPHLLSLARMWGWNDTEVRDEFAAHLTHLGYSIPD